MGSVSSKGIDSHFLTGAAEAPAPMMYRFGRTDPSECPECYCCRYAYCLLGVPPISCPDSNKPSPGLRR